MQKPRPLKLYKLIPNMLTLLSLLAGLSAIQNAIHGDLERAAFLIFVAAICDILDGAMARLLKANSAFGAELDSLADFLSFGVAPAMVIYMWSLEDIGRLGWFATAIFASASALRLARYNVADQNPVAKPDWAKPFFAGVPAPAGAGLALLPLFIWFQAPRFFDQFTIAAPLIAIWLIVIAALMVSRIPSFSTKQIKLEQRMAVPALGALTVLSAAILNAPWFTLSICAIVYGTSLPFAFRYYRKLERTHMHDKREDFSDLALGLNPVMPEPVDQEKPEN